MISTVIRHSGNPRAFLVVGRAPAASSFGLCSSSRPSCPSPLHKLSWCSLCTCSSSSSSSPCSPSANRSLSSMRGRARGQSSQQLTTRLAARAFTSGRLWHKTLHAAVSARAFHVGRHPRPEADASPHASTKAKAAGGRAAAADQLPPSSSSSSASSFSSSSSPSASSSSSSSSSSAKKKAPISTGALSLVPNPSVRAVLAALLGNIGVLVLKVAATVYSGSGVMMAESFHSVADVANQALLLVGMQKAQRGPSATHPYGYDYVKPAYALISATGFFFLGSLFSVYHGVATLLEPHDVTNTQLAMGVISLSMLLEGGTFVYAVKSIREMIQEKQRSAAGESKLTVWEYIKKGRDTSLIAVVLEDGAAVGGLGIAAVSLAATALTGNPIYDSIGTLVVGTGLGAVALFLIQRNLAVLAGTSLNPSKAKRVLDIITKSPSVHSVHNVKTLTFGGDTGRFKAEVEFNGREIARKVISNSANPLISPTGVASGVASGNLAYITPEDVASPSVAGLAQDELLREEESVDYVSVVQSCKTRAELQEVLECFGEDVVQQLGEEIDSIEESIYKVKGMRYIDLESHAISLTPEERLARRKRRRARMGKVNERALAKNSMSAPRSLPSSPSTSE